MYRGRRPAASEESSTVERDRYGEREREREREREKKRQRGEEFSTLGAFVSSDSSTDDRHGPVLY
jgi:hypothetical protein